MSMRKRKEVQEMLRRVAAVLLLIGALALPTQAAIWTEEFFGFERTSLETVTLPDTPIWEEYGFEEGERAQYAGDGIHFTATAWRFNDPTSAMAVYQWQHPTSYRSSELTKLAVETDDSLYMAHGNYVLHFEGRKPTFEELQGLYLVLPMKDVSALPTLPQYLPQDGLVPGSERFVTGPAGLEEFEPRIPLALAAFQYSTEIQLGRYSTSAGDMTLVILSYPTPHIARERLAEFRMMDNVLVKRSGPMVVLAPDPPDENAAQSLLGRVNYRATITWDQTFPEQQWTLANLILTMAALVGVVAGLAILGGFGVAGLRMLQRRMVAGTAAGDPMVMLHLDDK